ncbi:MAG: hypothetical protein CM15mP59_5600 [Flavobacteriaceae bacterium]|nr:MAG: hypothetical protein CM15mP59_5600 [Flavobacteriaceae bacterium]
MFQILANSDTLLRFKDGSGTHTQQESQQAVNAGNSGATVVIAAFSLTHLVHYVITVLYTVTVWVTP